MNDGSSSALSTSPLYKRSRGHSNLTATNLNSHKANIIYINNLGDSKATDRINKDIGIKLYKLL